MIKRLIFDLDNTLIIPNYDDMEKCILENLYNVDKEFAKNINNYLYKYEEKHKKYSKGELYEYLNYYSNVKIPTDVFEKMIETTANLPKQDFLSSETILKYLKSKGYEIVILTNWFKDIQYRKLKQANLIEYIDEIYCGEEFLKPNKECFDNAVGRNLYSECMTIGDNLIKDVLKPAKLGIEAIYLKKSDDNDKMKLKNQIKVIKDIKELKNFL